MIPALRSFAYGEGPPASSLGSWQEEPSPGTSSGQPGWGGSVCFFLGIQLICSKQTMVPHATFSDGKKDTTAAMDELTLSYLQAQEV